MKKSFFTQLRLSLLFPFLFLILAATSSGTLKEIDSLIDQQKYQEALNKLEPLIKTADKKDDFEYGRLLTKRLLLKIGLHGYETGIEEFRKSQWPKSTLPFSMVSIAYARTLNVYEEAYSWEIRQREKLSQPGEFDLKKFTSDEIFHEALLGYEKAWDKREDFGSHPREALGDLISHNNYPKEVRGTLRDTVSYLLVDLLNNSSHWKASESNHVYLLNIDSLLNLKKKIKISDNSHPLEKIAFVLHDLESWHKNNGNSAAALDARLELFKVLSQHFTSEKSLKEIASKLEKTLNDSHKIPWVSMGYAQLADLLIQNDKSDSHILALKSAEKGNQLFPVSPGASKCRDIINRIKLPDYSLEGMNIDGKGSRTLGVNYKNLKKLYFKSYLVDFKKFITSTKDYSLRPGYRELEEYLKQKPAYTWAVNLDETRDYRHHRSFVVPPAHKNGFYVIMASSEQNFDEGVLKGVQTFFSDYAFSYTTDYEKDSFKVEVFRGADGQPAAGANVSLYEANYQNGHKLKTDAKTDKKGIAEISTGKITNAYGNFFFIVEKDGNIAASRQAIYMYSSGKQGSKIAENAFIYTDRSIYRPEQKILWKVVAYKGNKTFKIAPNEEVSVTLQDANYQKIQTLKVKTNSFGSASGEFLIPKGKLLGEWSITSSHGGNASVKVEEYKRPTFIVEVSDKGAEYRLNKEANIKGNAKYYFGLPLNNGMVRWTIMRRMILPWWCYWGGWYSGGQKDEFISAGSSKLASNGDFEIKFTPKGDEEFSGESAGINYAYSVKVDVTDEGGETRSTEYNAVIGFTAVSAVISLDKEFYPENEAPEIDFKRTDLNGKPLSGKASWKLVSLKEPLHTPNPSELPVPAKLKKLEANEYKNPDDLKLKRWENNYNPEQVLYEWPAADKVSQGEVTHDGLGNAAVSLGKLKAGTYRLIYETKDSFGGRFETQREFIVSAKKSVFNLPAYLALEKSSVEPGEKARILVMSGYPDQRMILETFKNGKLLKREEFISGKDASIIEVPIKEEDRGGLGFNLRIIKDYQEINLSRSLMVPWTNKEVDIAFSTMRDKLRPGSKETWTVAIKGKNGRKIDPTAFEILAYMYDKSLDSFTSHNPPSPLMLYPANPTTRVPESELGPALLIYTNRGSFYSTTEFTAFSRDGINFYPNYGIGGPGSFGAPMVMYEADMAASAPMNDLAKAAPQGKRMQNRVSKDEAKKKSAEPEAETKTPEVRSNFSENGFWKPHLVPSKDGAVKFEFTVPDSVTSWQVWAHTVSKDLQSGKVNNETRTIKELMVRPYLPRFFREGDEAAIKVVVNNSSDKEISGNLEFDIFDEDGKTSLGKQFSLSQSTLPFKAKALGSASLEFKIKAPVGARNVVVKAIARSGSYSDGEIRPLPVLPGRVHLAESKFVTLKNKDKKEITFPGLKENKDSTLVNDLFVVTLDAQLFYSVLSSVPYLVNYPYQCTEQMMNVFVSSGILASVFEEFPEVNKMAREFSKRKTRLEKWNLNDPNRKTALEEAPWLAAANGGGEEELMTVLHPDIARNTRNKFLELLKESQTSSGGFPWFSGGPPSPYVTLYILYGFSKAVEFKVDVPKEMISRAWSYLHQHYVDELVKDLMKDDAGWEFVTFLNYVLSNYPDTSWSNNVFTAAERKTMLDFSMKHWKEHSPYLKSYLAMTLKRDKREADAKLVWESVMDSAKVSDEEGTHWSQEDRSWLWYNDTIETHALALRTGSELGTKREALDGMVQWLFLNKKLNHWKSTKGTAEVLYSLTKYLKKTKQIGTKDKIDVSMGSKDYKFEFDPSKYTGKNNQIVYEQQQVSPNLVPVSISKTSPGLAFASATWHYSTEKLPKNAVGDFLSVTRKFFKRSSEKSGMKLTAVNEGDKLEVGDEVEIHLSLTARHQMEYVHLRDPRGAGLEPVDGISQHKWDLGIYWYEEIRDSGTNFFFERLPKGNYNFKYRVRASTAGKFRVGPAVVQPLYAPEFVGFSEGHEIQIK